MKSRLLRLYRKGGIGIGEDMKSRVRYMNLNLLRGNSLQSGRFSSGSGVLTPSLRDVAPS